MHQKRWARLPCVKIDTNGNGLLTYSERNLNAEKGVLAYGYFDQRASFNVPIETWWENILILDLD